MGEYKKWVSCSVNSICEKEFSEALKSKAISSLIELQKADRNEVNNFICTVIGNINFVGNTEAKKQIIHDSLPPELQPLWKDLDHQEIEA